MRFFYFALIIALAACDAGHLGNPLTLPVRGVISGIENANYDARRTRVAQYLRQHQHNLNEPDVQMGLWGIAPVPAHIRPKVLAEIGDLADSDDWVERATVIVMVHH